MVTTTPTPLGAGGSALEPVCPQIYTLVSFVSFLINPLTRLLSVTVPILPLARSLSHNGLGDKGASAIAAVLKEKQITILGRAAAPSARFHVSAP